MTARLIYIFIRPVQPVVGQDIPIAGQDSRQNQMTGREANIALVSTNHTSAELNSRIGKKGIATKHGHFYAYRVLKKMGFDPDDGVLRLSFAHYNDMAKTLRLTDALADISV